MHRLALSLALAPFALGVWGCGASGPTRYEVSGKVTLKGQPLDDGIIEFLPEDNQGTKSGAQILNGAYRIPKDKGLAAGKYRVVLYAGDGTTGGGNAEPSGPDQPGGVPGKERIPPQFNEKTTLVREVKAGSTTFDFDIP